MLAPLLISFSRKKNDLDVVSQMLLPILGKNSDSEHVMLIRPLLPASQQNLKLPELVSLKTSAMTLVQRTHLSISAFSKTLISNLQSFSQWESLKWEIFQSLMSPPHPPIASLVSNICTVHANRLWKCSGRTQGRPWNSATAETTGTCTEIRSRKKRRVHHSIAAGWQVVGWRRSSEKPVCIFTPTSLMLILDKLSLTLTL